MECGHESFKSNVVLSALMPHPRFVFGGLPAIALLGLICIGLSPYLCLTTYHLGPITVGIGWAGKCLFTLIAIICAADMIANLNRAFQVTLTERGLGIKTMFTRREIRWDDITFAQYNGLSGLLTIKLNNGQRLLLGRELSNFNKLRSEIEYRSGFIKLDPLKRPEFFLEPHPSRVKNLPDSDTSQAAG